MSKSELRYTIKSEINKINKVIDHKIVRGLSYNREAHYHKVLLRRLSVLRKSNFLARTMRLVGTFIF